MWDLRGIRKGTANKVASFIIPLYTSMVRPHLQYFVRLALPHHKNNRAMLEMVQKRTTQIIKGLENLFPMRQG